MILRCIEIEVSNGETGSSSTLSFFASLGKSILLETFLTVSLIASDFTDFSAIAADAEDAWTLDVMTYSDIQRPGEEVEL